MEVKIAHVRDEWIDKFKTKWDIHIKKLTAEKKDSVDKLILTHTKNINMLKIERDDQIRKINLEFSEKVSNLKKDVKAKKLEIEKKHSDKLNTFLNTNLKQVTLYDSICSYILNTKNNIFKGIDDEEPEIIAYQQDIQYIEPYPSYNPNTILKNPNITLSDDGRQFSVASAPPSYSKDLPNSTV